MEAEPHPKLLFSAKASAGFAAGLRKDVYCKVQEFSFANIDHFSTGSLVTRLISTNK